jgi:3-oxoacyl-[acyl-carrier protein] reductase
MATALVTGGGRGIGENIARRLAAEAWDVTVTGRTRAEVEAVAASIGGRALVGDVSKREDVERWRDEAGDVDLLVCNAGVLGPDGAIDADPDEWWRTFEVNVLGTYLCAWAFTPGMIERGGGRIVNVASVAAYLPNLTTAATAYGASKAAVHRFSEVLAERLAPQNVFVFSIVPGLVKTAMTARLPDDSAWAPPEAAPALVAALASGEFDELTGRFLHAQLDAPDALRERVAEIVADDLNAVRFRR